jgi:hypothetical protein
MHTQLSHYVHYTLNMGKVDKEEILPMLELRRNAIDKLAQAVREGHGDDLTVRGMLQTFNLTAKGPLF